MKLSHSYDLIVVQKLLYSFRESCTGRFGFCREEFEFYRRERRICTGLGKFIQKAGCIIHVNLSFVQAREIFTLSSDDLHRFQYASGIGLERFFRLSGQCINSVSFVQVDFSFV